MKYIKWSNRTSLKWNLKIHCIGLKADHTLQKKKKISEFEETAMETIREAQRENKMNRVPVTCGIMWNGLHMYRWNLETSRQQRTFKEIIAKIFSKFDEN